MKTTFVAASIFATLILVAIPTFASRLPLQSSPRASDVFNSINQWSQNVDNVNNFLNVIASLVDPTGAAANPKQTTLNEPVQLGYSVGFLDGATMPGLLSYYSKKSLATSPPTYKALWTTLRLVLCKHVQLTSINNVRCLNVLPTLDILRPTAAAAVGIDLSTVPSVQRPDACATIC